MFHAPPVMVNVDFVREPGERKRFFSPIVTVPPLIVSETSSPVPPWVPRKNCRENVAAPSAIPRAPSASVTASANVLSPVSVQPSGASMLKAPVPVMSPPKVPEPRRVPPETMNVPAPTGEGTPAGMSPVRMSVPPESVVPPVCMLEGLSFTVPGPET